MKRNKYIYLLKNLTTNKLQFCSGDIDFKKDKILEYKDNQKLIIIKKRKIEHHLTEEKIATNIRPIIIFQIPNSQFKGIYKMGCPHCKIHLQQSYKERQDADVKPLNCPICKKNETSTFDEETGNN